MKPLHGDADGARKRAVLSKLIADNYQKFEKLRDTIIRLSAAKTKEESDLIYNQPDMVELLTMMEKVGLVTENEWGGIHVNTQAKRYISGVWLEELVWLAANEAGADESIFGQVVGWQHQGYSGENEIDLLFTHMARTVFVSCKAMKSDFDINDKKQRNRLMEAVHEADNLTDHFGKQGDRVAVVVTTDLYDEIRQLPRYQALMGKASVLDVHIIALEQLHWNDLVQAMKKLME